MDNIFDIGSLSVDYDTMERTNPIFNTAKMTLFQLADNMPELAALSEFSAEQQAAIKQAMTRCAYWKITPISSTEVDTSDSKTTDFDVKASVSGGTLDIRLFGRVDTITSPKLLALWEKVSADNKIVSVNVDCSGLDYISSAGLRVLLVMHKGSEQGVSVSGTNEVVREIFAQTGFIDIFNVNPYGQYYIGQSYLAPLSTDQVPVFNVTFEPGCRNNWHIHHASEGGGQMLICVSGRGWYQEWGKEARELHPGDVVNIPEGVKHWHGAACDSWFQHLAIEVPGKDGKAEWLEPVDDEQYTRVFQASANK